MSESARWNDAKVKDENLLQTLLREGGAIGSFDTRIRVGFAVGMYGVEMLKDLLALVRIRNMFAHRIEAKDFTYPAIQDRVRNLTTPERFPVSEGVPFTEGGLELIWLHFTKASDLGDISSSRQRFLRTIEIMICLLAREQIEGHKFKCVPVF